MERPRPLPWLLLALGTGVAGWFLGRSSVPAAELDLPGGEARQSTRVHEGPMLSGLPSRGGSRSGSGVRPSDTQAPPGTSGEERKPAGATELPVGTEGVAPGNDGKSEQITSGSVLPGNDLPLVGFLGGFRQGQLVGGAAALPEDTVLTEITKLMASDPGAANDRVERLLESGLPEDRKRAYSALAQARHPLNRRLAQRALEEAKPDDDVQALMRTLARFKGRDWSAEQLTGPPDTPIAGDLPTAWASREQDMGEVWIELDYPESVMPERLRIHETLHPGAVARAYAMDGDQPADPSTVWVEIWRGEAPAAEAPSWFEIPLRGTFRTRTIRIIVDTSRVPGWNEIDAVELTGDGRSHWAIAARAGSSYGE